MRLFKRIISYVLVIALLFTINLFVFAEDIERSKGYHVYDEADLLSDSEWKNLENTASEISELE